MRTASGVTVYQVTNRKLSSYTGICEECDTRIGKLSMLLDKLNVTKSYTKHDQVYMDNAITTLEMCTWCSKTETKGK